MSATAGDLMYVSQSRLDDLYARSVKRGGGLLARLRGANVSVLGTGGGAQFDEPDQRFRLRKELERVRSHLNRAGELGSFDDPRKYFYGRLSMFAVPFDLVNPAVLYLVGGTERTVVALGGPLERMVGRDPASAKSREGARVVISERDVAAAIADAQRLETGIDLSGTRSALKSAALSWDVNVVAIHRRFGYYPDKFEKTDVETLAWREAFSPAPALGDSTAESKSVLLGRPIFIAYA